MNQVDQCILRLPSRVSRSVGSIVVDALEGMLSSLICSLLLSSLIATKKVNVQELLLVLTRVLCQYR